MAILSNINDLFRVDSAGAVYFATSAGANLQVLQSVGTGGSPIWVDVDDIIGGPYLPLAGGTLTGNLALTDATNNPSLVISTGSLTVGGATTLNSTLAGTSAVFTSDAGVTVYTVTAQVGAKITFSDEPSSRSQKGFITYRHVDTQSYGSANSFIIDGDQATMTILADGKLMYKEGVYLKPATGTGAGTRKDNLWDAAYNDKITALAVAGTTTKTLTATQQDGGTLTASWTDNDSGGTVKGTGTGTRVAFWSATDTISSSADLYWDNTNNRLGVGLTSPSAPLHVVSSTDLGDALILEFAGTYQGGPYQTFQYNEGGSAPSEDGDLIGGIRARTAYNVSNGYAGYSTAIEFRNDGAPTSTSSPGVITFLTTSAASVTPVERLRINSSGNAFFYKDVTLNQSINTASTVSISNLNTGSASQARFVAVSDGGNIQLKSVSIANTTYGAGDAGVINCDTMSGGFRIAHNDVTKYTLSFAGNNTWTGSGTFEKSVFITNALDAELTLSGDTGNSDETKGAKIYLKTDGGLRTAAITGGNATYETGTQNENALNLQSRRIRFHTATTQDYDLAVERMSIETDGNVTIQTSGADDIKSFTINSSNGSSQVAGLIIENDGANGYINFKLGSGNAAPSTKLTIGNAANFGNVGIGVTGPVTKLELPGSLTNSSLKVGTVETQSYSVNNAWIADNVYYDGSFKLRSNGHASQIYFGTSNGGADISFKRYPTGSAGDVVTGVTSLQLLGDGDVYIPGKVGIGYTAPNAKLHVLGSVILDGYSVSDPDTTSRNAYPGDQMFTHYGNNGVSIIGGQGGYTGCGLTIGEETGRSTSFNFIRGVSDTNGGGNAAIEFSINGVGTATFAGDVVAYGSPSDKRLKENIKPIKSALDKVSKLQGVTFDWKKSDSELKIKEDIGFIAQDVQKVIPELVRKNSNGLLSMRHQGVIPMLVEAIKELEARVKELENK